MSEETNQPPAAGGSQESPRNKRCASACRPSRLPRRRSRSPCRLPVLPVPPRQPPPSRYPFLPRRRRRRLPLDKEKPLQQRQQNQDAKSAWMIYARTTLSLRKRAPSRLSPSGKRHGLKKRLPPTTRSTSPWHSSRLWAQLAWRLFYGRSANSNL